MASMAVSDSSVTAQCSRGRACQTAEQDVPLAGKVERRRDRHRGRYRPGKNIALAAQHAQEQGKKSGGEGEIDTQAAGIADGAADHTAGDRGAEPGDIKDKRTPDHEGDVCPATRDLAHGERPAFVVDEKDGGE